MQTTLIIIHVILSVALIAVVLLQHGKQQGLSGAIAGGAETFFGKNKGRTIDEVLKKVTGVVALLFVISSIVLAVYSIKTTKTVDEGQAQTQTEAGAQTDVTLDAEGNLVDADGNILITAEDMAAAEAEAETETETAE